VHIDDGLIKLESVLKGLKRIDQLREFKLNWNLNERHFIYDILESKYEIYRTLSSLGKRIPPVLLAKSDSRLHIVDGRVLIAMDMSNDNVEELREALTLNAREMMGQY
jgi:hypothetical protein